jgi:hypothetical protein
MAIPNQQRWKQSYRKRQVVREMVRLANAPLSQVEFDKLVQDQRAILTDMRSHAIELGLPPSDGDWFYKKLMRDDWCVGGIPVDDWRRTMRTFHDHAFFQSQRK